MNPSLRVLAKISQRPMAAVVSGGSHLMYFGCSTLFKPSQTPRTFQTSQTFQTSIPHPVFASASIRVTTSSEVTPAASAAKVVITR